MEKKSINIDIYGPLLSNKTIKIRLAFIITNIHGHQALNDRLPFCDV